MGDNKNISYDYIKLTTFHTGGSVCGIDINMVQEINKNMDITPVPSTPEYVVGVLNLRGDIITVIDLSKKLGLSKSTIIKETTRNVVINLGEEFIAVLVDQIGEVITGDKNDIEPAPSNLEEIKVQYISGILKTEDNLITILNIEKVLTI